MDAPTIGPKQPPACLKWVMRCGLACVPLIVSVCGLAGAQSVELPANLPPALQEQLRSIQQDAEQGTSRSNMPALDRARDQGQSGQNAPAVTPPDANRVTALEEGYRKRVRDEIGLVGYGVLTGDLPGSGSLFGSVPDDYVVGLGDEVVVTFRGQLNKTTVTRVDREGRLTLEGLPPVAAAGLRFDALRAEIEARTDTAYLKTEVFVSLGSVRNISVLVSGEVSRPGQHSLTGFSSVIDALIRAGGITKSGSLRRVTLLRGGTQSELDLYDVLFGGAPASELRLREGDQILVKPIGTTFAVLGDVIRSGIYEFPVKQGRSLTVQEAVELSGGSLREVGNRLSLLRLDRAGRDILLNAAPKDVLRPNDILLVSRPPGGVALEGAVKMPGERSIESAGSLLALLQSPDFLQSDPYLPFAVIITEDSRTKVRRFAPVDLDLVFNRQVDFALKPEDTVIIFSREDIRFLVSADVQAVLSGNPPPSAVLNIRGNSGVSEGALVQRNVMVQGDPVDVAIRQGSRNPGQGEVFGNPLVTTVEGRTVQSNIRCAGLRALAEVAASGSAVRFTAATRFISTAASASVSNVRACPEVFDRHPDLLPFVLEYAVSVQGEVRIPGVYPSIAGTRLESIIRAAGGLTMESDSQSLEVTFATGERNQFTVAQSSSISLSPGDSIRAGQRATQREFGVVEVSGEVLRPGRYELKKGERLSDLLARVGGITEYAYPIGAVFTRERVRQAEVRNNDRVARELELALPTVLLSNSEGGQQARLALPAVQALAASIRNAPAVGRVPVEVDPAILASRPELNFVLEAGDRLVVPKRPNHVSVTGEVLNPGQLIFRSGSSAKDYLRMAGGATRAGDVPNAFIIFPNGEASPLRLGSWTRDDTPVPPGSTIVIPRDPQPFNWLNLTKDLLSITRDLAVSAASVAVIGRE